MENKTNKKSQITIFVIAGILIVAIVLLFFFLKSKGDEPERGATSPESILETCLKQDVYDALQVIGEHGGDDNPELGLSFRFENEPAVKIAYLCYTSKDREPCTNQEPLLFWKVEREMESYLNDTINYCVDAMGKSLEKKGYAVDIRYFRGDFEIDINENGIDIKINADMTLSKNNQNKVKKGLKAVFKTKFYDLIYTSRRIIYDERVSCSFDIASYVGKYPDFSIDREITLSPDFSKIYTVKTKNSPEIFRFAVRSCVDQPGA
ncbi:hypothetical protein HYT23_00170 [Candidatus Pacearchaeota archaeon]|nr:hypothetical protein [Candidatus Pacearchaeota archaeon]